MSAVLPIYARGESSLRIEVKFHSAVQNHPLEQFVFADVASDVALELAVRQEQAHAEAIDPCVIADRCEVPDPLGDQGADQILGIAAESESADHDNGSVEYVLNGLFSAGNDFSHGRRILTHARELAGA